MGVLPSSVEPTPIRDAEVLLTNPGRNDVLVRLVTEDGLAGWGKATLNGREKTGEALAIELSASDVASLEESDEPQPVIGI